MKERVLGEGLRVSALGLGCMALTQQNYGPVDEREAAATLREALDRGISLLDTAETYGVDHANESFVGRVIAGRRAEVVIATKFGVKYDPETRGVVVDSRPEKIRSACEGSLRRLGTDYIDLYIQHRVDPRVPIEEVWGELSGLVREGKVLHLGMSEPGIATLRRAHAVHPVCAIENEYSLFSRDPEEEVLPVLRELGIGLICYAPLGRGLLSGRLVNSADLAPNDFRRSVPRYQGSNLTHNLELVERIRAIARRRDVSAAQLSLAWLLAQGGDVVPIPGMERRAVLRENCQAVDIELEPEDLRALDEALADGPAGGRRADGAFNSVESPGT